VARGELLLELLSEEIPARMQRRAIDDLTGLVRDKLAAAEIPAAELRGTVTPRRLTVIADGIPERQPDRSEERRGPRVGAPQQALDGFLRAAGIASIEQCEVRDTGRGEFYFAIVQHAGRPAAQVLPELLKAAIAELPWPKSMRFPAAPLRWVRPLTSVLCLFGGEVLPLSLGEVPVGRTTCGHRFLSPGEIAVDNAQDYVAKLEAAYVVLDQDRRRDLIAADLDRVAQKSGVKVKPDPGLLDEITGLAEFPVVLIGAIDDESMALPPEVLATAMRTHQKYFTCLKADGSPAPRFLFVANNKTPDAGKTIVAGNERVLKARLADARFFWDQDRKIPLADRVDALKDRVYYEKLGTVYDKVQRMEALAEFLVPYVPGADSKRARRAALLSKADLSTGMVGEFPELQGIMGRYYALYAGKENEREDARVADAIADHYKPLGPNDTCPTEPDSNVVALADKLDTLEAFFFIGEGPTGSRDPFALRRAALGVIRIILENDLRVSLFGPLRIVAKSLGDLDRETANALEFITDRLEVHLRSEGVRYDIIKAAFLPTGEKGIEDDLIRLLARVDALTKFVGTEDGADLLVAFRRASNIVEIEARKGGWTEGDVIKTLLIQAEEQALAERLDDASARAAEALRTEDFPGAMSALATLRGPVDEFFDSVTVNTDEKIIVDGQEKSVRENRLRLLLRIRAMMNQIADFRQIGRFSTDRGTS
jgi:glycyl-tRNA synthetase beta chain